MANVRIGSNLVNTETQATVGTVEKEVYLDTYYISPIILQRYIKHSIVRPVFALYLLNEDETIKRDVSEYLVSGSLSINFQNGQRKNLSLTLLNYDKVWNPSPFSGWLWHKTRFRLDAGIIIGNTIYWKQKGIFIVTNPDRVCEGANNTVSIALVDKFGLWDGTVSGITEWYCKIPLQYDKNNVVTAPTIKEALTGCVNGEYGNGEIYDRKPLIMDSRYQDELLAYTISQNPNSNTSQILLSLAEMISCDIYYNDFGNMTVTHGIDEVGVISRPIMWQFNEGDTELKNIKIKNNWSDVKNRIVVIGAVINGDIMSYEVELTNPKNKYCIDTFGCQVKVVEDTNIYSENLAKDRGIYELQQSLRKAETITFDTSYIPQADVGQLISINSESLEIPNGFYFVNSVNMSISTDATVSWTVSSAEEGNNVLQEISR